jgi:hypothetical protein
MWELRRLTALLASMACYRDSLLPLPLTRKMHLGDITYKRWHIRSLTRGCLPRLEGVSYTREEIECLCFLRALHQSCCLLVCTAANEGMVDERLIGGMRQPMRNCSHSSHRPISEQAVTTSSHRIHHFWSRYIEQSVTLLSYLKIVIRWTGLYYYSFSSPSLPFSLHHNRFLPYPCIFTFRDSPRYH